MRLLTVSGLVPLAPAGCGGSAGAPARLANGDEVDRLRMHAQHLGTGTCAMAKS